ncbi:MAG: ROK family protein [Verrucomicrobia bacterium]|nr:ROK family protein [Verrucomicrobiota bacterium]
MTDPGTATPRVLVIDVGGHNVKILVTGQTEPRKIASGPKFTAEQMVAAVKDLSRDLQYEVISIGYPGPIRQGRPAVEPYNLGKGWVAMDYAAGLARPVKIINDAAMQAIGSYKSGKMLFLGLGTGLGSALVVERIVIPTELCRLPYRKATFEDYVGTRGLERFGKKKWRRYVAEVVAKLTDALEAEEVVLGGGNVKYLKELPPGCRVGDNNNAFTGGFRLWDSSDRGVRVAD